MKQIYILIIFLICLSCNANKKNINFTEKIEILQEKNIDTICVVEFKNKQYKNDKIQLLELYDTIKGMKSIEVINDAVVLNTIELPNSEDVKNFSIDSIFETKKGFDILASWGGGQYFYRRIFSFIYKNDRFYFYCIARENYKENSNKEVSNIERIMPMIPLNKFDITYYIDND